MFKVISILLLLIATSCLAVLPLTGGIVQGQYMATIFIGTPPQPFTVQIDTGSGKLGINCASCPNCQNAPHPPFNMSQSSTSSQVTCVPILLPQNDQYPFCQNCYLGEYTNDWCSYRQDYYDKSWISG